MLVGAVLMCRLKKQDAWRACCGHVSAPGSWWHAGVVCARVVCCTGLAAGEVVLGIGMVRPCGGYGS